MSAAYHDAAIPEPFRVLGLSLKPFTLGHQLLLERFESSFALGSTKEPTYEDLILSVFLCSFTWERAVKVLSSRFLKLRLKLWGWFCGSFDVAEAMDFFARYLGAHSKQPDYWVEQKSGPSNSGVPFIQFLKVKLEQDLGYTEAEALGTPYQIAIWNYLTFLESKGVIKFVSQADLDLIALAKSAEMEAKMQAIAEKMAPIMKAMQEKVRR